MNEDSGDGIYRRLVEQSVDIPYWAQPTGELVFIGEQIKRYGIQPEQALAEGVMPFIDPADHERVGRDLERTLTTGEDFATEFRLLTADGPRWLEDHGKLIRDQSGEPIALVGFLRDITDQRQSLRVLSKSHDELSNQLAHSEKMAAIAQLTGGVAHDFNNVLTVIASAAHMLEVQLPDHTPGAEELEVISAAIQRGAELTRQLLAFSRHQRLDLEVFNPNDGLAELERMLRRLLGDDVVLELALTPNLWLVRADRGQLDQMVINLVVNARDAMPEGGQLTLETRNVRVDGADVELGLEPGPYVALTVSDTGTGIAPETQARLFEPFFSTKAKGEGTGLGLSTVYGIVRQLGGAIAVQSEPGEGAAFTLYLPRVALTATGG